LSAANMNRRAREPDGTVTLGLDPDGPVDRRIGLVRRERPDGKVIALVANYAMHGTVLGEVRDVSADAPGVVANYVEEKLGAPMLYIQGAAGNIFPIYYMNPGFRNLPRFTVLLGDHILAANRSMRADSGDDVSLAVEEKVVETARKPAVEWPADLAAYHRETGAGAGVVRLPLRFLRLRRDTVIWAAPVELFCEIALRVRTESPFVNTLYFGYANGWLGYLPTEAAFKEGGYEPGVSAFTGAAEKQIGDAVIEHLQGVRR
jgi:neutral ceramidase